MPVQVNFSMTHRSIEYQCSFIGGSKRRCFKPETIPPNSDKRQSARTSGMFQCRLLPILHNGYFLLIIMNAERAVNSPVVRYCHRLPTGIVIPGFHKVCPVFTGKFPSFFKQVLRTYLRLRTQSTQH